MDLRERGSETARKKTRGLSFCRINLRELEDNRITGKRLEIILVCWSSYLTTFVSSAKLPNVDTERRRRSNASPPPESALAGPAHAGSSVSRHSKTSKIYALV